jgi:pyruvate/2-oxoglutarate dehydrogenase complex dihydrolipoamide acyltransferase (E2) component
VGDRLNTFEYQLPAFPLGGAEATVVRWLKRPGEALAPGEPLLVVVNDRLEVALPAPEDGTLEALLVAEGESVAVGGRLARIARAAPAASPPGAPRILQAAAAPGGGAVPAGLQRASPVARRAAAAAGLDLATLVGSGPGGRVMKHDVLVAAQAAQHDAHVRAPSRMRRAIAEHMVRSRATAPHALTAVEVDMGQVAAVRERYRPIFAQRGLDLTYTACIALAVVEALLQHPLLNSTWSDAGIILRRRVHLGIAVALPDGLITPVVRDAQDLNLRGMARAVGDLARRARVGALRPGETSGGTFTITNPGSGAIWFGTPIINQPQSAILGVGAIGPRPLVVSEGGVDRIAVRPTAILTLAYDARVIDQSHADAFLGTLKRTLERFTAQMPCDCAWYHG